jgi:hypothetical protein
MKNWIRNLLSGTPQAPRQNRIRSTPLSVLALEDRTVLSDFRDVGGLRFFTDGVYSNTASTSSTNSLVQVGLTPGFGETFTPLLDVPAGVSLGSNPLFAKINTTLSAGGLTFTGNNLTFTFDTPNKKFGVTGEASFSFNGVTISSTFGSPTTVTPGLVIQNGKLASIDVGVTSSFKVANVGFDTQDLRLKFDSAAGNRYAISGKATASVQGTSPISLTTQFGESPEEPGLVIVNGKLNQLAVGVSSTFAIGGLALEAKDLTLALNTTDNSYKFFGAASAKFGNNAETVGFDLLLGNSTQPGVSIVNGKLNSLNAGVTSNFNVAGVSINTKALTVTLNVPTNTFTISGSAGFSFAGVGSNSVSLDVQLGQSIQKPGIKIVNGKLTELSVGVTGAFNLAGLSAEAKDLTFTYNRAFNRYGFSGSANISTAPVAGGKRVLDRFGVQFGSLARPGILVQNGRLERLDIALNGQINLGSLSVNPRNLRVEYSRLSGVLQFTGGLTVSLASRITASADLINGGLTINTDTGAVRLNGLRLGISDTKIGTVFIRTAFIQFTQNSSNIISLSGGANVDLPAGISVDGSFDIVNGRLRRIMLNLSKDPGVPVGNTGIFVSRVTGELNNLDTPDRLIVTGSMTFTAGPSYRIAGRSVSLLQGTVSLSLNLSGSLTLPGGVSIQPFGPNAGLVILNGQMSMLGDAIPAGNGNVTIAFNKSTGSILAVRANVNLRLMGGFFVGSVGLDLNGTNGDTTIRAGLAIQLPDITIPEVRFPDTVFGPGGVVFPETRIAGIELAAVEVTIRLLANTPLDSSLSFEGRLLNGVVTGTATVTFRGDLTFSGTALAIPFGPITKKLPALFEDPTANAAPTLRITSTERVLGSPTNDLIVNFAATPGNATLDQAFVRFNVNGSPFTDEFTLQGLATRSPLSNPRAGFNPATGTGFITLQNPDRNLPPLTPLSVVGTISQNRVNGITTVSQPFGPINGIAPRPSVTIQSTQRIPNSPTNDLLVTFRVTSAAINTATLGFKVGSSPDIDPTSLFVLNRLDAGQTFNAATGIGTTIIRNPERLAAPGQSFTITGEIQDNFGSRTSAAFGPITPVFGPPTIAGPSSIEVPTVGQATLVPANTIVLGDPASQFDPTSRLRLTITTDSSISLEVLTFGRPASIVIEQNRGRTVTLTGTVNDLNIMMSRLLITRVFDNDSHSMTVILSRPGVVGGSVQRDFTIPANIVLGVTIPSSAPSSVNAFGPGVNVLAGTTIQLFPNTSIRRVGIKLVQGTGTNARPPFPGDVLNSVVSDTSPVFPFFDRQSFELVIAGDGTETLDDFVKAIQATTYQTTGSSGRINIRITITDSRRQVVTVEKQIVVQNSGFAKGSFSSSGGSGSEKFGLTSESPFLDVGPTLGVYTGSGPAQIAPALLVSISDPSSRVVSATVSFTGLYDATSDQLVFTPVGNITGTFDSVTGILTLSGDANTTTEEFQSVLRSVSFRSLRRNPTPYPRELLFTVTDSVGLPSQELFGRTLIAMEVPTVRPSVTGTTTNLAFPPNGEPLAVFPDFDLVYPDEALPPPSVPLGTFIPGSTITRATVSISTNYIRGEDFLTFAAVGQITGIFYQDTGELLLEGTGSLAEYEQVIRSVKYQNRNTSASTADRVIELALDDGSGSSNPPSLSRVIKPQSDGLDTIRVSGSLTPVVIPPTTPTVSLGLTDLNYAPRPGETLLIYTIISTPQGSLGTVVLTDGTVAQAGMEVPIEQLRGARFVASNTPRSGTVPFTFTIAGVNPITRQPTETPLTATVPIEITNVAPRAGNDQYTIASNKSVVLGFLGNDTDLNGDLLLVESFTQPANGRVSQNPLDGSFTYRPNDGFVGNDPFTYTITDGAGGRSTATVTMTVTAPITVVPPPIAKDRTLLLGSQQFAVGADVGSSIVNYYNSDGSLQFAFDPFPGFTGGVRTASADFNRDGVADLVMGTGPGRSTRVVIIDGKTQAELFAVDPFESSFTGGVFVSVGDLTGDGIPDLAITPDEGGGPRVDVFSGAPGFPKLITFFGIDDPNFRGGARSSIADINGDGVADLIVVAGFGGGPRVASFDGRSLSGTPQRLFSDFFAFEETLRNGIFVTAGDLNGDGKADLIAGGGPGGGPRVLVFDGASLVNNQFTNLANFFSGDVNNRGGIRLAVKDLDGDDRADLVVGSGSGAGSRITSFLGKKVNPSGTPETFFDFDAFANFPGGVFVG